MKFLKSILLSLILIPAFSSCASVFELVPASPKNVLYVRTNGNDATAWYGTSGRPWGTITNALAHARVGDKVIVGPGNFTNTPSYINLPTDCTLFGSGTNSTFIYSSPGIYCSSNNQLGFFTLVATGDDNTASTFTPALNMYTNNYVHDLVVISDYKCVGGAPSAGYNVFSNCTFITGAYGIYVQGVDYFFNCAVLKTNNNSTTSSYLMSAQFGSTLYWSGGRLTSTTNATGQATNNCGLFHGSTSSGTQNFYVQNATISVPAGGYDVFGKTGITNFLDNVTYSSTNSAAINIPFAGFANTNPASSSWLPSWVIRPNTNNSFLLPAPPGS